MNMFGLWNRSMGPSGDNHVDGLLPALHLLFVHFNLIRGDVLPKNTTLTGEVAEVMAKNRFIVGGVCEVVWFISSTEF